MSRKNKTLVTALLIVVCVCSLVSPEVSAAQAQLYANPIKASWGATVIIPVQIRNNPGIMGYHFVVRYDPSVCFSPKVTKGEVTENGMMDDNTTIANDGAFDVIWTSTEDVKKDGTIMTLAFQTQASTVTETVIELECVKEDTFNEQWEDVTLTSEPIIVSFVKSERVESTSAVQNRPPTYNDIIIAVESVKEPDDSSNYVDSVNSSLFQLTGQKNHFKNYNQVQEAYKKAVVDRYVESVTNTIPDHEVQTIVTEALSIVGAKSIDDIPVEKRSEFLQYFEQSVQESYPDIEGILDCVDVETGICAIQDIKETGTNNTSNHPETVSLRGNIWAIVLVAVVIVLIAIVLMHIHIKKQKRRHSYENG